MTDATNPEPSWHEPFNRRLDALEQETSKVVKLLYLVVGMSAAELLQLFQRAGLV